VSRARKAAGTNAAAWFYSQSFHADRPLDRAATTPPSATPVDGGASDNEQLQRAFAALTNRRACAECKGAAVLPGHTRKNPRPCTARLPAQVAPKPATVQPCSACSGRGGRETAGSSASAVGPDWLACEFCCGSGRDVVGELPDARAMASRLEQFVAGEMLCVASDVPGQALDLMVMAASVLRAEGKR
jgi:hypothetical protein